ncbi:MAG: efflux RND transporter permease subunit [Bacteroidales bacterium]
MLTRIIEFSVRNKLIIALLVTGLVAWGIYSLGHITIDAVPDITNNQVQIVTVSPNLAAQEVEQFITYPIEMTMANVPNVVELEVGLQVRSLRCNCSFRRESANS